MKRVGLAVVVGFLLLGLVLPEGAAADAVGRLTQVEGRVDLLKGGNLPATPAKLQDGVEVGDVLRTKSLSRATVTFVDDTTLAISPDSRVAIEDYMFDGARGQRRAVLQIFQGLAHAVVHKLINIQEPNFIIKTHTAVLGVRGTDLGFRIHPGSSTIMNFQGKSWVRNILPEIKGQVELSDMQGTTVVWDLPPTLAYELTQEDKKQFMKTMAVGLGGKGNNNNGAAAPPVSGVAAVATALLPTVSAPATPNILQNVVIIPPQPTPPTPVSYFTFSEIFSGPYTLTSTEPFTTGTFSGTGTGSRTGVYAGSFTANYNFNAIWDNPGQQFPDSYNGTFDGTMSGRVRGRLGQTLTGTTTLTLTDATAGTFTGTVPVTITPAGVLTCNLAGLKGTAQPFDTPLSVTSGSLDQTPSVALAKVRKK